MREEVLELDGPNPDSLRPLVRPEFPVRELDPGSSESLRLVGRRAAADGDPARGIVRVVVDGAELPVAASRPEATLGRPASVVELGVDRLFRYWDHPTAPFEELWITPIAFPFVVRRWRHGAEHGARLFWTLPADAGAASRLRKIAASWSALDRSWKRDVSESAQVAGPDALVDCWAWSRARLLSAVRAGPDRDQVQSTSANERLSAIELTWIALGLNCLGRSDLAADVIRKITDLDARSHATSWTNRWLGRDGPQPDEEAQAFLSFLTLPGRTDLPVFEWPKRSDNGAVEAGAFCGRLVDEGFGVRPDSRFGRIRFGPSESVIRPTPQHSLVLSGLCVGRGQRPFHMTFGWATESGPDGKTTHTVKVTPGTGAVPLQLVLEPKFRLASVGSVTLDGQRVESQISEPETGMLCVRLQCPLDGPRSLRVEGTAQAR